MMPSGKGHGKRQRGEDALHKNRGSIRADGHKPGVAQRELAEIARGQVQRNSQDNVDADKHNDHRCSSWK